MNISTGLKIKAISQVRGLGQIDIAKIIGASRATVSYIINGHIVLKPEQQQALEQYFGLRFDDPLVEAAVTVLATNAADRDRIIEAIALLEKSSE